MKCTTHHYACNCREREFQEILAKRALAESQLAAAKEALKDIAEYQTPEEYEENDSYDGEDIECEYEGIILKAREVLEKIK